MTAASPMILMAQPPSLRLNTPVKLRNVHSRRNYSRPKDRIRAKASAATNSPSLVFSRDIRLLHRHLITLFPYSQRKNPVDSVPRICHTTYVHLFI
jgi:hypothetical protein